MFNCRRGKGGKGKRNPQKESQSIDSTGKEKKRFTRPAISEGESGDSYAKRVVSEIKVTSRKNILAEKKKEGRKGVC